MWRSLMFWRLFGAYSLLLAASLGLLGWILHSRVENHLLAEIRQGLESKTVLVQELIAGPDMDAHQRQQQIVRLAQETDCRITLLAADGTVLADSAEDPRLMDNHLNRPEVRQAEATGVGAATRYSETMRQPMMYVARR
ncbi:MAG TPA: hypothetical protein VNK04_10615, partial [Gemmataceae bacterium]|nr:hypothetical protein [Gemmataceae bacterium]